MDEQQPDKGPPVTVVAEQSSEDTAEEQQLLNSSLDHVIQSLVQLTNMTDIEFGITLTVAGFLISGTLVSGKRFFDGLAQQMADSFQAEDVKKSIHKYFNSFGDIYDVQRLEDERRTPIFIHLREAKLFHNSGKPIPGNKGVFWRGRISQVSGFCMGTLSVE